MTSSLTVDCQPERKTSERCNLDNIKWPTEADLTRVSGLWYFQARHRGLADFESGKVNFTVHEEDMDIVGEYAFRV